MAKDGVVDTKWLVGLLKKSFHNQKPLDVLDTVISQATSAGENMMSTVYRVRVTMLLNEGRRKTFSFVVKNQVAGGKVESVMGMLSIFPVECKAYTVILPMMGALMDDFEDTRNRMWGECLGYQPYNCIVMEDLSLAGYTCIDRTKWQSVEQAKLVLRTLARFHAMTKVLLARGLLTEDDRGRNLFVSDTKTFRRFFPAALTVLSNAIKTKWGPEWEDVGRRISDNIDLICDKMKATFDYDKKYEVYNHGDLWTSNMMWKFTEYGNIPVSVKFIDWQFAHINSFIIDVVYFMYSSIIPSVRRNNLDLFLETYQESLERNLKFFKWEGHIPTVEEVKNEHDRVEILSFIFVASSLPNTSSAVPGPSVEIGNLFDHPPEQVINEAIFTEEKFIKEVAPDLRAFCTKGVL